MLLAIAAFALGLAFGAVVHRTHFCTMGAIADLKLFGSRRRLRAWILAATIALLLTQALALAGLVPLDDSRYRAGGLDWLGALLGGGLFGFGMVIAGGCVSRGLARFGAGNLKSLVVLLVAGVAAQATAAGVLAAPAGWLAAGTSLPLDGSGLDQAVARVAGLPEAALTLVLTLGLGALGLYFCLKDPAFRRSPPELGAGLAVGLLVALGWLATSLLGNGPPASLTFIESTGATLGFLMSGPAWLPGFLAALGLGAIAGAFLLALATRTLRLEAFTSPSDLVRHAVGGALMGVGGALAGGCTIGQGVTGIASLGLGSALAVAGIFGGALWALDYLETERLSSLPRRLGHACAFLVRAR
jgi:uncharacterized membrane protein YedE/YeeE